MAKLEFQTLEELREAIRAHKETAASLIRHLHRIEQEYSDWEDRVVSIENAIEEAEKIVGLKKEEIETPKDVFEEFF
mgnify:CR=1 FL=1